MPVAFVQEFDVGDDRSTANYDALNAQLRERGSTNAGRAHRAHRRLYAGQCLSGLWRLGVRR